MADTAFDRIFNNAARAFSRNQMGEFNSQKLDLQRIIQEKQTLVATNLTNIERVRTSIATGGIGAKQTEVLTALEKGNVLSKEYRLRYERNHPQPVETSPDIAPLFFRAMILVAIAGISYFA